MEFSGASAYDNDQFFENYITRRNREESPNNMIEKPILLELIGDIEGKKVLDLGCGDAKFGIELLQKRCISYDGVEGSKNMVKEATKNLNGSLGKVHFSSMETWDFQPDQYDLIVSRLAIHYLADLKDLFKGVHYSLTENGRFIFSVQHPLLLSSIKGAEASSLKTDWIVDDYFTSGKRVEPWIDKNVVKYHRTTEEYYQLLKQTGFKIDDLREGTPRPEEFRNESEYKRRMRIPLFLIFSCVK
ncbi:class I SAM-dependent methyltransferase [Bacillus sp. AFS031507]|uniref:class I SAM-dependent DNA methyltransferase n=1 Tax=Bacillus sp. AFS031507 TaxID=2033496 RepID=UPI000BFDC9E6|nr:class I SAM-dependent methyltransferase [Bacillus sp. AFS031507]PGY08156.1 SAM-dependent methyltransferase [Bacillus sp. AFS031507]